jgi:hypothetical protein
VRSWVAIQQAGCDVNWVRFFRIDDNFAKEGYSSVAAVARKPDHLDLFATGTDGGIYSTYWDDGSDWAGWFRIDDGFAKGASSVAAVARNPDQMDLFVRGSDGGIYSTYWDSASGWAGWFRIDDHFAKGASSVAAVACNPDHMDLFVTGTDNWIYSTYWDNASGWARSFRIDDHFAKGRSPVTAISRGFDHLDLFIGCTDGGIYSTYWGLNPWPLTQLEGYVSSESVLPDESLTVHVRSTIGPFRIQLLRRGLSDVVVSDIGIFPDVPVDLPLDGPENGCDWPAATTFSVPAGSPSGLYILRLSTLDGGVTAEVPFIVRSGARVLPPPVLGAGVGFADRRVRTRILFALPTSTYEAYNWWGGRSLYGHGLMRGGFSWSPPSAFRVSSRRPYLSPDDFVKPKFQYWEMPFIRWLERNGITVDYCTSVDLHTRPELLNEYKLVVTAGHDEYWSWEMRDNIEQFVAGGGTMLVLSGNSVWWQIRFEDGDAITCYKSANDDPVKDRSRVTVTWYELTWQDENHGHVLMLKRPEILMTGVSFHYGGGGIFGDGLSDAPVFQVVAEHPILQNTNLTIGDTFGKYQDNVGGRPGWKDGWLTVLGYETDARPTPTPELPLPDPLDWRANWDEIIPVDLNISRHPGILFYQRSIGEAELHGMEPSGKLTPRKFHEGWSAWEKIIPGNFGKTGYGAILLYDRYARLLNFYAITEDGGISLLRSYDDWRQSCDQIVPGNFGGNGYTDLLFYDRSAGQGEFYTTDGLGNITPLQTQDGWRQSWDLIVPGNFGGSNYTGLLFYDRGAGVGEFYATDGSGNNNLFQTRSSWDQIVPVRYPGVGHTALLFYDRNAGTGEFYTTDGAGGASLLKTHTDWPTTWKVIVPLKLDNSNRTYLFFYEQETGNAELYFADPTGNITFVRSYGDRAFTLIARSVFPIKEVTREYASLGFLRIGEGKVFTASTTDWSFGLSQSSNRWSVIDQITANLLCLYGSAPSLVHPLTPERRPPLPPPEAISRIESYGAPRRGKEPGER